MEEITIDVVIPVFKPQRTLACLLRALKKQTRPIHRIILINTEKVFFHEEDFRGIVDYEIVHISRQDFDHAATRQMGMDFCREADYVLMMTQDAVPADSYLVDNLVNGFKKRGPRQEIPAVVYARQLPRKKCSAKERFMRNFSYPAIDCVKTARDEKTMGIRAYFCSDVCALYDRKIFEECGGYVKNAIFNEDMLYAFNVMQRGYAVCYAATAKVIHSHDYNCVQQFKRHFDMGVSQAEHPEVFNRVSSEKEGIALVEGTCHYLAGIGHAYEIPYMILNQASRYAGYLCGKHYRLFTRTQRIRMSSNPSYWEKNH